MVDTVKNDPSFLMEQAKNGNQEAFGSLYKLYFVPVFRYVSLRIGNRIETEDLTQTVFLKVFKSIERYRDENKDPLAYFFTVARNTVIDFWRKKKRKEIPLEDTDENELETDDSSHDLVEQAEKELSQNTLKKALGILTDEQKEVIVLKFISDLSNKEISDVIGKSEEAIRQLQCRALKKLRDNLKNHNIDL